MTKLFIKKVWGYSPKTWPCLGFGTEGGATKLGKEYQTGDWIVLVGTKGRETVSSDKGRLLGIVQVTNQKVPLENVLTELGTKPGEGAYLDDGSFKWPVGFPYLFAKSFVDKPLLADVLPNRSTSTSRAEAAYAIQLSSEDAILALPTLEDDFPIAPSLRAHATLKKLLHSQAPTPALGLRNSNYGEDEDGSNVYCFKIKGLTFIK